jgi:hypothetical protein
MTPKNECPNAKLSFHGAKLRKNPDGSCYDCGRKLGTGATVRFHYADNGNAAIRTTIMYEGAPLD